METIDFNEVIRDPGTISVVGGLLPTASLNNIGMITPSIYCKLQSLVIPNNAKDEYYKVVDILKVSQSVTLEVSGTSSADSINLRAVFINSSTKGLTGAILEKDGDSNTVSFYVDTTNKKIYIRRKAGFVSSVRIIATTDDSVELFMDVYSGPIEDLTLVQ